MLTIVKSSRVIRNPSETTSNTAQGFARSFVTHLSLPYSAHTYQNADKYSRYILTTDHGAGPWRQGCGRSRYMRFKAASALGRGGCLRALFCGYNPKLCRT